ncbi:MAG TPA: site-specific integrase, partial [Candidatus Obscuribacterales bacterium]
MKIRTHFSEELPEDALPEGDRPRYVQVCTYADGSEYFRYNPPQVYVDAGIVPREVLAGDELEAYRQADEYNRLIDEFRFGTERVKVAEKDATLTALYEDYIESADFKKVKADTKRQYHYFLKTMLETPDKKGERLGDRLYESVTSPDAKHAYDQWAERGTHFANHVITCASRLYRYGMSMGYVHHNPFGLVKRKGTKPRRTKWNREQLTAFLDTAYSDFGWRNVGLIAQMAYEWGQRLGDMRMLQWDGTDELGQKFGIDWDNQTVTIIQSKRSNTESESIVAQPISDELFAMLKEQHELFDFQPYVAPYVGKRSTKLRTDGNYGPYTLELLSKTARRIMDKAGLPKELRLSDLRRTAVTELVDGGATDSEVMA